MPESYQANIAEINKHAEHAHDQAAASRTQNTHLTAHEETRRAEEQKHAEEQKRNEHSNHDKK